MRYCSPGALPLSRSRSGAASSPHTSANVRMAASRIAGLASSLAARSSPRPHCCQGARQHGARHIGRPRGAGNCPQQCGGGPPGPRAPGNGRSKGLFGRLAVRVAGRPEHQDDQSLDGCFAGHGRQRLHRNRAERRVRALGILQQYLGRPVSLRSPNARISSARTSGLASARRARMASWTPGPWSRANRVAGRLLLDALGPGGRLGQPQCDRGVAQRADRPQAAIRTSGRGESKSGRIPGAAAGLPRCSRPR